METTSLNYQATKLFNNKKEKITVSIRLNDECNNGHQDFSITCTGYIRRSYNSRWIDSFGGCAHDEILKHFPQFKMFVDLHLADFRGVPMYAIENGFYFIKNGFDDTKGLTQQEYFCNYFRVNAEQCAELYKSENKLEFAILLKELGVLKQWRAEAKKAISELEKLTGDTFLIDSPKLRNVEPKEEEVKEFKKLKKEGYFSDEAKQKRKDKRLADKKKASIEKIEQDFNNQVEKFKKERDIKLEFIRLGFEVSEKTGNMLGAIYYNHTNEINFNWSTEKIKDSEINYFIENIDRLKFKGLKISNNKEVLETL